MMSISDYVFEYMVKQGYRMEVYVEYQNIENDSLDCIRYSCHVALKEEIDSLYDTYSIDNPLRLNKKEYAKFLLVWKGRLWKH